MSAAADAARVKLSVRELGALRAELRRELADELAAAERARRDRRRAARVVESADHYAAARRMTRALGKRAGTDVDALQLLAALREDVDAALHDAVDQLRTPREHQHGHAYSWADIGARLGITRQSAQERFTRKASA